MLTIVPHCAKQSTVRLWVAVQHADAAISETLTATVGGNPVQIAPGAFNILPMDDARLHYQFIDAAGLVPGRRYDVSIASPKYGSCQASFDTLPDVLGGETQPLRVLLASCYCTQNKSSRLASKLFEVFSKPELKPHVRVWAGDQVYLDAPWYRFMVAKHSQQELAALHARAYARTFLDENGLASTLRQGANIFCPDDHEFWNNAPEPNIVARDSKDPNRRTWWWNFSRQLLEAFQGPTWNSISFDVAPLSFFVLDTRSNRELGMGGLISTTQLAAFTNWLSSLNGPGVLVIGQPVFDSRTARHGTKGDYHLADYRQYAQLMTLLASSKHSLVVLSGDVHFSRVAQVELRSGKTITEIISSPLAIVAGSGKWHNAPERLDIAGPDPFEGARIKADTRLKVGDESAMSIGFYRRGQRVFCSVDVWRFRDIERGQSYFHEEYAVGE